MSHYARNHLQDDWNAAATAETAQRLREAEQAAGWYFGRATRRQRAAHDAGTRALSDKTAPECAREREALDRRWLAATVDARALFEATVACLFEAGEVSPDLDDAWTALFAREDARSSPAEAIV